MANIIFIYSTTDGHTRKICSRLVQVVKEHGNQATLVSIHDNKEVDLKLFDKIVIGASIRYGKHQKEVYQFIKYHSQVLEKKPNAFFSVNVVARKPDKNQSDTNPYIKKFLMRSSWQPRKIAVFAGKIDYQKYNFLDRFIIRLIMWMTKGPTDTKVAVEFTNWGQVKDFGLTICKM
jgi:menaquinone-dependent protoporphyrinogen oxidase